MTPEGVYERSEFATEIGNAVDKFCLLMIAQPLFQAIISPYAGKLPNRFSPFKVATTGMVICAVGLFCFCFIGTNTSLSYVIAVKS
jgi:MFS family permease